MMSGSFSQERSSQHRLVFLPGFILPASSYRDLLAPLVAAGCSIEVPQFYRIGPRVLLGRYTVSDEAQAAADLITPVPDETIWLGGHSRGGHAALVASRLLADRGIRVAGLLLIDPVRNGQIIPDGVEATASVGEKQPQLIVGAGLGGRCAPTTRNHRHFAREVPRPLHVVVPDMGHADVLNGRSLAMGRRLCGGGVDPTGTRSLVTQIMTNYIQNKLVVGAELPPAAVWA